MGHIIPHPAQRPAQAAVVRGATGAPAPRLPAPADRRLGSAIPATWATWATWAGIRVIMREAGASSGG
ncbi:hypothetical protein [Actinomyces bowdenii]|uniref:Uncharacterized protein n=1 Tax=Actinomyces bowdenii TaxID=131109 RepID=A0A853EIS4_9ACTO|nr:hypothetical protein [Actinomyces bowdenii]MBF0697094.1 hypothetical protein [Actinomyces bowdenii]NYS69267.1 hypothetical protein [Actinomyces bowdenii]